MFELNDSIKKPSTGNTGGQIEKIIGDRYSGGKLSVSLLVWITRIQSHQWSYSENSYHAVKE